MFSLPVRVCQKKYVQATQKALFPAKKVAAAAGQPTHQGIFFFCADVFVDERLRLRWGREGIRNDVETDPQRPTAGNKRTGVEIGGLTSPSPSDGD